MKQYKIVSADFLTPGESLVPDAVMDAKDLHRMRQLAGLVTEDFYEQGGADPAMSPDASDGGTTSPLGSIQSKDIADKKRIESERHIKPGSDEWFRLWFAKPYLTGEKPVGDLDAPKIEKNKNPFNL